MTTGAEGTYACAPASAGDRKLRLVKDHYRFSPEHQTWDDDAYYSFAEYPDGWGMNVWSSGPVINFYGFLTPHLRAGDALRERLHPREPSVRVRGTDAGGVLEWCDPCQVLEITVDRPGHLFVGATWADDLGLALWVDGLDEPNVGNRRLLRDITIGEAGTVRGFLGRASTWTALNHPIDLDITTRFVPE